MSVKIKPRRGYKTDILQALLTSEANEMLVAIDSKEIYIADGTGGAVKMTDVIFVNTRANLDLLTGIENKIYICLDEYKIYTYKNSEWKAIIPHLESIQANLIAEDSNHRFVTDIEKNNWNNKVTHEQIINITNAYPKVYTDTENIIIIQDGQVNLGCPTSKIEKLLGVCVNGITYYQEIYLNNENEIIWDNPSFQLNIDDKVTVIFNRRTELS